MRVVPGAPAPGLTGLSAKQYGPSSATGSPSIVPGTAGQGVSPSSRSSRAPPGQGSQ